MRQRKPKAKNEMYVSIDAVSLERRGRLFKRGDDTLISKRCELDNPRMINTWIKSGDAPASVALAIKEFYEEKERIVTELNTPSIAQ